MSLTPVSMSFSSSVAALLLGVLAILPLSSVAQSVAKAPTGSRNNEIKFFSFCLGQTIARIPKLTEAFKRAEGDSWIYLIRKTVDVYKQGQWMLGATAATLKSVENPDSDIFTDSKAKGEKMGAELFEIEDKCLTTCATSNEGADLGNCVDSCINERNSDLYKMSSLYETVYGKFQAANRAASDNYAETCSVAEDKGRLDVAEQACYRALVNVDLGNLGPELKSQRLYNLGRIKRQLAKFSEAEQLFRESLAIEEKLTAPSDLKIGRRLVELSVSLAGQDKWAEGAQYLERILPTANQFVGQERSYVAEVLNQFGKRLKTIGQVALAERFVSTAATLR